MALYRARQAGSKSISPNVINNTHKETATAGNNEYTAEQLQYNKQKLIHHGKNTARRPDNKIKEQSTNALIQTMNINQTLIESNQKTATTQHRQKSNTSNHAFGDNIDIDPRGCRILLQNINGLQDKAHHIGNRANELNISIIGLVETNTDWSWKNNQSNTSTILRKYFTRTTFAYSHSAIGFNSSFQPGGTLTIAGNKWGTRAIPSSDPHSMGRWSKITIPGRFDTNISIFSVYRVCDQTFATSGVKTAFRQQYIMAADRQLAINEPRQLVLDDLSRAITECTSMDHGIIILIDANESIIKHNSKFANWISSMSLVDPLTMQHGSKNQPPSVDTGSARIDFILVSTNLHPYVTASGILPKYHFTDSDHRAQFIDIDLDKFLKGVPIDKISHSQRGIKSDNPKAVAKYQRLLEQALNTSNIERDLQYLTDYQEKHGQLTPALIELAKQIDNTLTTMKLNAEAQCRNIRKTPWSPQLAALKSLVYYWNSWRRQGQSRTDGTAYRTRLCPHMPQHPAPSMAFIRNALKDAQKQFKQALLNADDLRSTHLQELAQMYANTGRASESNMIAQIRRRETIKQIYRRCNSALRRPHHRPLTHVIATSPGGSRHTIIDQSNLEDALNNRNRNHFSQADGTPFTAFPLVTTFGPHGTNAATESLLKGTHSIKRDDISEATQTILQNLPLPNVPQIDSKMYDAEIIRALQVWREETSTSPTGDHLGHDKALLRMTKRTDDTDDNGINRLAQRIFHCRTQLLNLSIQNTIVFDRWLSVINTMIEKDPGNPRLERLRIIHIISADFNMIMGIFLDTD